MSNRRNPYLLGSGGSNPFSLGTTLRPEPEERDYTSTALSSMQERLNMTGYNPEQIGDGRNAVQRFLNMSEDTGVIGGFFDLMNRPTRAIAGAFEELTAVHGAQKDLSQMTFAERMEAIDQASQAGESALSKMGRGFMRGLTHQTDYSWSNVIRNLDGGRESEGLTDWSTWAGMGLDMLLDPMALALIPVTGGASVAAKGIDTAGDVSTAAKGISKAADTAKKIDSALDAGQVVKAGSKAASLKKADNIADAVRTVAGASSKIPGVTSGANIVQEGIQTAERFKTIKTMFKGMGKGFTFVGNITDPNKYLFTQNWVRSHQSLNQTIYGGIIRTVGKAGKGVKSAANKAFDAYAKNNPEHAADLKKAGEGLMQNFKNYFLRSDTDVNTLRRVQRGTLSDLNEQNSELFNTYLGRLDSAEDLVGHFGSVEEASKKITQAYEFFEGEPHTVKAKDFFSDILGKRGTHRTYHATDELMESLQVLFPDDLSNYGITTYTSAVSGKKMLQFNNDFWNEMDNSALDSLFQQSTQKNALETLAKGGGHLLEDWTEHTLQLGTSYSAEEIQELMDLFEVPEFTSVYNDFSETMRKIQTNIGLSLYGDANAIINRSQKGYVPHTLNPELRTRMDEIIKLHTVDDPDFLDRLYGNFPSDDINIISPSGSTSTLRPRTLQGTIQDVNLRIKENYSELFSQERWVEQTFKDYPPEVARDFERLLADTDWFTQDSRMNLYDLMSAKTKSMSNAKLKTDILVKTAFDGAIDGRSGLAVLDGSTRIPAGAEILSNSELRNLKRSLESTRYYGGDSEYIKSLISTINKGLDSTSQAQVTLDKNLRKFVGTVTRSDGEDLLQMYDKLMSGIRGNKLLNPAYNIRNVMGNTTNMWLSGMSVESITRNLSDADTVINYVENNPDGLLTLPEELREFADTYIEMKRQGAVGSTYKSLMDIEDYGKMFDQSASADDILKIQDWNKKGKKGLAALREANMGLNMAIDDRSRLAVAMEYLRNPDFAAGLGVVDNAIDASRFVMFDPSDLSLFENQVVKRASMFYTFFKQNIVYHARNLYQNTDKYYRMYKFFDGLNSASNLEDMEKSQWDSIYDVTLGEREDGTYNVLRTNNPFQEFLRFTEDPIGSAVGMLVPPLKSPIELAQDQRVWDGSTISDNYALYALEHTGLDIPAQSIVNFVNALSAVNEGDNQKARDEITAMLGVTKTRDTQANIRSNQYRVLERLQDFVESEKEKGREIPTLTELRKQQRTLPPLFGGNR